MLLYVCMYVCVCAYVFLITSSSSLVCIATYARCWVLVVCDSDTYGLPRVVSLSLPLAYFPLPAYCYTSLHGARGCLILVPFILLKTIPLMKKSAYTLQHASVCVHVCVYDTLFNFRRCLLWVSIWNQCHSAVAAHSVSETMSFSCCGALCLC